MPTALSAFPQIVLPSTVLRGRDAGCFGEMLSPQIRNYTDELGATSSVRKRRILQNKHKHISAGPAHTHSDGVCPGARETLKMPPLGKSGKI